MLGIINEKLSQMGLAIILRPLVICDYWELDNVFGCFGKLLVSTFTSATFFGGRVKAVGPISLTNTDEFANIAKSQIIDIFDY